MRRATNPIRADIWCATSRKKLIVSVAKPFFCAVECFDLSLQSPKEADALTRKAIELAKERASTALRLCIIATHVTADPGTLLTRLVQG
jgi:hypothetical protein